MRIALITDLHANETALKAVLDDIARAGVDQTICLGDVATLGPSPIPVIQRLMDLNIPCIMGNHDDFLIQTDLIHKYTNADVIVDSVDWCREKLTEKEIVFIKSFKTRISLDLEEGIRLMLFHGSPQSHMDDILATTTREELDKMLLGHEATIMAGGHTHIQMLRQYRGRLIVNPGSLGCPFEEYTAGQAPKILSHAEYAVVSVSRGQIDIKLKRLYLEKEKLRKEVEACDMPLRNSLIQQYS
jgi:putative phosphoesterase